MKCPLNVALAAAAVVWGVILAAGTAGQLGARDAEAANPAGLAHNVNAAIVTTADIR